MSGAAGLEGVSLRYDRHEDRLVLSIARAEGTQRFWLTRRQCVGLIRSLSPAARKAAAQAALPRGRRTPGQGALPDGAAPLLAVISLRRGARAVRLGFSAGGGEAAALECSAAEFVKLQCIVYRLAEAAQWAATSIDAARPPGGGAPTTRRLH